MLIEAMVVALNELENQALNSMGVKEIPIGCKTRIFYGKVF